MGDKKFSVILGLGGNSYSNLQVSGDSAEELRENIKAIRTGPEGESVLELANETVYGVQGMYEAAKQLGKQPDFVKANTTSEEKPAETNNSPETKKKTPAKKSVAARAKAEPEPAVDSLAEQIKNAEDGAALTALWKLNKDKWNAEYTALAEQRREELSN